NIALTGAVSTTQQDIGSGSSSVASSASISGLTPNTTYYYEVMASSSGGSSHGAVASFTTAPVLLPDLVITSLTAPITGVVGSTISVNMTVSNQGNAAAGAFSVEFYFSTTPNISTGAIDTGLNCSFNGGLGAGASTSCSGLITIPVGLAAG